MLVKNHFQVNHSKKIVSIIHRQLSSKNSDKYDDYNYFKPSILRTDHFQYSLPRLPIPKLENTCERYLTTLKPILNDDAKAFEETKKLVDDFRTGDGQRLDKQLREKNKLNRHTSYISKPWFEMYLKSRLPLILNFNFFLVLTDDPQKLKPAARVTNYIISSVRFMNSLRSNTLDPEVFHLNPKKTNNDKFRRLVGYIPRQISFYGAALQNAYPLDMSQYARLFNSTRIPKSDCDILVTSTDAVRHIIVIKGGHYYKVTILDKNGQLLPPEQIASMMKYLCDDIKEKENPYPLGYFTADKRDRWANIREQIEKLSEHNRRLLKEIDNSIMVICLDQDNFKNLNPSISKAQRAEYVSGQYLCNNAANRWFDKSFNMIMLTDGTLGLHCEHSWGDGVALLRFCNDIDKDANENGRINAKNFANINSSTEDKIEKLEFQLDDKLKNDFQESKQNYDNFVSRLNLKVFQEPIFGKTLLKKLSLGPDAMMQLGIQMAYHKLKNRFVSTYESCSTAVYKHGRTETIRPVTNETKAFIESLSKSDEKEKKRELLKKCSEKHQQLIKEAATGQGFDRHLFALKYLQQVENQEGKLHPIYTDRSYQMMNHTILSTSTVASKHILAGGFGPVVDDGFGVGYLIDDDQCGLLVTSYMKNELPQYVDAAGLSYRELANLIQS